MSIASISVSVEDDMTDKKHNNPQWKNVVLIDYKSGQAGRAREIVNDYYKQVSVKTGTRGPELVLKLLNGAYDLMVIWVMQGGVEGMKWRKALNELVGSEDKAAALLKEYLSCINSFTHYIAKGERIEITQFLSSAKSKETQSTNYLITFLLQSQYNHPLLKYHINRNIRLRQPIQVSL